MTIACRTIAAIRAYGVMLLLAPGASAVQEHHQQRYLDAPPRPSAWTLNEEWIYCHHRASCGTRAEPGLQITPEDPAQWNDGVQCFCEGYYKTDGTAHNGKCYRGTCDAGVERRTLRSRAQDSVRQLSRDGVLEPIADADARGLCKFQQLFDNQVDARLCSNHLGGTGSVDINYGAWTDPPPKDYGTEPKDAPPSIYGMPLSPQESVDKQFWSIMKNVADEALPGAEPPPTEDTSTKA